MILANSFGGLTHHCRPKALEEAISTTLCAISLPSLGVQFIVDPDRILPSQLLITAADATCPVSLSKDASMLIFIQPSGGGLQVICFLCLLFTTSFTFLSALLIV